MASVLLYCLLLVAVITAEAQNFSRPEEDSMIWTHRAVLDREGKVVLFWLPGIEDIIFELQVQAKGWIGIGFSPDGNMPNSDIVIGWVFNNEPSLQDRFAIGHSEPVLDDKQDYKLLRGYENDTHTVLRFQRRYDTCDTKDTKITNDTMRVIYAYTENDPAGPVLPPHTWQGHRKLILTGMTTVVQGVIPNTKSFEMRLPNITLSKVDKVLCWQKVFKYTPLSSREVVIGFEPLWRNTTAPAVDHLWLYRCDSSLDSVMWDQYSNDKGSICDSVDAIHQYGNCTKVFATATAGSLGYVLPGKVGYSLNQFVDGPSFFLLRVAYSEWKAQDDIQDDTGIAVIYTSDSVPIPAGTLTVGHELGLSHVIPIDQKLFTTLGHCDAECTKKNLPQEGIFIYEVFFDARTAGRKVVLKHMRNGTELEHIAKDEHFDSGSQIYRMILDPVNVIPGDNLILECTYDTTQAGSTLVGGINHDSESCRAYLNYFPRISMQSCTSSPPLHQIFDFLGTKQIAIEPSTIEYKDVAPGRDNMKLIEYVKYFNWVNRAADFQNLTKSSYTSLCSSGGGNFSISEPRLAPKIEHPYYEISVCNVMIGDNRTQVVSTPGFDQGVPIFHPDGTMSHPGGSTGGQDPFNPMLGDQSHGGHEPDLGGIPHDHADNETNVVDTQGFNHSASTQKGNSASSLNMSFNKLSLIAILTMYVGCLAIKFQ